MGIPLHNIRDIRRLYGRHIQGRDSIDFDFSERAVQPRHCIAVRITSENSDAGFQPSSGKIKELQFRSAIDVWGYFSVDHSGLKLTEQKLFCLLVFESLTLLFRFDSRICRLAVWTYLRKW